MEITVEKMAMIRENYNPKNTNLNLDIDWFVEYTNTDQDEINFTIVLRTCENFNLNFKVEGIAKLYLLEEFIQEDVSQAIFCRACDVLMNMISLTRDSSHSLFEKEYSNLGSGHFPNTPDTNFGDVYVRN